MRSAVIHAQVGFHFDDSSGGLAMHQDFAQAIAGDFNGGPRVEIAIEYGGVFQELVLTHRLVVRLLTEGKSRAVFNFARITTYGGRD
jgi:hypothetical protein